MMLGFPPPLFFQICWRFVSPAIIFVSSLGALPGGSGFGHRRGLKSQMCAHSEVSGPGLGLGSIYRAVCLTEAGNMCTELQGQDHSLTPWHCCPAASTGPREPLISVWLLPASLVVPRPPWRLPLSRDTGMWRHSSTAPGPVGTGQGVRLAL